MQFPFFKAWGLASLILVGMIVVRGIGPEPARRIINDWANNGFRYACTGLEWIGVENDYCLVNARGRSRQPQPVQPTRY